jgi:SAM-dependent methyltransferase
LPIFISIREIEMKKDDLLEFEAAYRSRLTGKQTRWHPGEFDDFGMRPFLESTVANLSQPVQGMHVLDLGCGTGQVSAFFAARGAVVIGIDISPTAIEFARQRLLGLEQPPTFYVGDVRDVELPAHSFDLVIDCDFLHCVVSLADREIVLQKIATWLKPGGELWSETMIGIPKILEGKDYFLDEMGIFWKNLDVATGYPGSVNRHGKIYSPIRRIWPDVNRFNLEMERIGLKVIYQEQEAPGDDFSAWMIRTRAKK